MDAIANQANCYSPLLAVPVGSILDRGFPFELSDEAERNASLALVALALQLIEFDL